MKKIFILLTVVLFIFLGCTSTTPKIINPPKITSYEEPKELAKITVNSFINLKDEKVKGVILSINNLTNKPLNIVWEESSINNNVIFKDGMKYIDAGKNPPKTIVFPNGTETVSLFDSSSIYYLSGKYGGWNMKFINLPLKLILTVEQDNKKEQYIVEITNVVQ